MSAPRSNVESPRLARWFLRLALPRTEREVILGDLEEIFHARIVPVEKSGRAQRWYWKEAFAAVAALRTPQPQQNPGPKGDGLMRNFWQDIRYGVRMLAKSPGFTLVAVLALALGIGANTAIFSVVNAVLLKPLPFRDAEQLVLISENNLPKGWTSFSVAPPNFVDWRAQTQGFNGMAAFQSRSFNYTGGETPERLRAMAATEDFFPLTGVQPVLGRTFVKDEFQEGRDRVALITNAFWLRRFGGKDDVLGQSLMLNGQSFSVVGVLPEKFTFGGAETAVWVPRVFNAGELSGRGAHFISVIGRMKPDVPIERAQAEMTTIAGRLAEQYPNSNKNWGAGVTSLREAIVGDIRPALLVLLGAVGFVLLIACANVANMQLARATVRSREIAIRTAMGAGRGRIVRQLMTEGILLSIIGGGLGALLALWGVSTIVALNPGILPRASAIRVDGTVLAFTFVVAVLTGLLFGLAPALAAARTDLNVTLKEGGRGGSGGGGRHRLRSSFVVAQVALALVLLIGSGLFLRSFARLQSVAPGFNTEYVLTFGVQLPPPKYPEAQQQTAFFEQLRERMGVLPGVQSAALVSFVPLSGADEIYSIGFESRPGVPASEAPSANYFLVSVGYFRLMGIPLLAGRDFTEQDTANPIHAAIVNEAFVRVHFRNENPIGQRIRMGRDASIVREIVGVVGNVKNYGLGEKETPQMYETMAQYPRTSMIVLLRTSVDPLSLSSAVRREIQAMDPQQPVTAVRTLEQIVAGSIALPRFRTVLLGIFGGVALVLAAVGLYGVMSYSVSQRTQEIGIRMALGAQPGNVLAQMVREGMLLVGIGLGVGVIGAYGLTMIIRSSLQSMLFEVGLRDVVTFAGVPLVFVAVALLATIFPARRATQVDPLVALRYE